MYEVEIAEIRSGERADSITRWFIDRSVRVAAGEKHVRFKALCIAVSLPLPDTPGNTVSYTTDDQFVDASVIANESHVETSHQL